MGIAVGTIAGDLEAAAALEKLGQLVIGERDVSACHALVSSASHPTNADRIASLSMHRYVAKVRWSELDPYAHLNHAVYLTMCETARIDLLDQIGWGLAAMKEQGFQIVVVEVNARFLAPAEYGDELLIQTKVADISRASTIWHQQMFRGEERLFSVHVKAAMTDLDGKLLRPPAGFRLALEGVDST